MKALDLLFLIVVFLIPFLTIVQNYKFFITRQGKQNLFIANGKTPISILDTAINMLTMRIRI